jgi:hypothetical protein
VEKSLSLEIQIKKIFQNYFAGIPASYPNMRPCAEVTDQGKSEGLFGKRCLSFPFTPSFALTLTNPPHRGYHAPINHFSEAGNDQLRGLS